MKQSRLGFAPQNGRFNDIGLVGSTRIFDFGTVGSMTYGQRAVKVDGAVSGLRVVPLILNPTTALLSWTRKTRINQAHLPLMDSCRALRTIVLSINVPSGGCMAGAALGRSSGQSSDELFRRLVDSIKDYAIFVLSPDGNVLTWNPGAEALTGYNAHEVLGTHFAKFYLPAARQNGVPMQELAIAEREGRFAGEHWHVSKNGSRFWASVVITPLRDSTGEVCGFAKVTQDCTARRDSEERINKLNLELQTLSAQVLRVQDDERRRIARELHDDLGQQLLALKMFVDKTKDDQAIKLSESALTWVRNLSYLLHPPLLDEMGLTAALNWFVDGLTQRSGVRIELKIHPDKFPRLGTDIETAIFRIAQESLTNVFRHANSDRATVELEKKNGQVVVRIRDYGKGFPANGEPIESTVIGVGIGGMRERIRQFGGELKVSRCEPGTMVAASIPLPVGAG